MAPLKIHRDSNPSVLVCNPNTISESCTNATGKTLNTADAELAYERSTAAIAQLTRDEEVRKLLLKSHFLADELDDLNESLLGEAERADEAEERAISWQEAAEDANDKLEAALNDARSKKREIEVLLVRHFERGENGINL